MKAWHERDVTYLTESPAAAYTKATRSAPNVAALLTALRPWHRVAPDAIEQAEKLTDEQWAFVCKHRRQEQTADKVFELAGCILLPMVMIQVDLTAQEFRAPWGTAFIQLRKFGRIVVRKGALRWKEEK